MAEPREDEGRILVCWLRALSGWDQRRLAEEAGLSQSSISRYEAAETVPPSESLAKIAAAVGLPLPWVERRLLPVLRAGRELFLASISAPDRRPGGVLGLHEMDEQALITGLTDAIRSVVGDLEAGLLVEEAKARNPRPPSPADRAAAAKAWQRLSKRTAEERRWLVEQGAELQTWALAERLCEESEKSAANDAASAIELAALALHVASLVRGEEPWRQRLSGYAHAYLGNARRVAGAVKEAAAEFETAWELWRAGGQDTTGLLEEWRLLDLEASLCRDLRNHDRAMDLLTRAEAAAPSHAAGRIRLKLAFTLEQAGDVAGAVAVLREAAPLVAANQKDPRLQWILELNLCVNLCHLGQYPEVEMQLPRLRELAASNQLDLLRVAWLGGRVAAGAGRRSEACDIFERLHAQWLEMGQTFAAARVALELAQLYIEEGRTAEVRELAAGIAPILAAKGVESDAVASLRIFCRAAQNQRATTDQVREALRQMGKSRFPCISQQ